MKANKIDKEFLVKNKFWVMLGTVGLFEFIVLCILLFGGGDIAKVEKEWANSKSGLAAKKNGRIVNQQTFLPPWQAQQEVYRKKKNEVWGKAWETQNVDPKTKEEVPVITWPTFEAAGRQKQLEMAWFGDDIEPSICGQYRNAYNSQFYVEKDRPSMRTFLFPRGAPANFRFPVDGDPERIFRPVVWKSDANPTPEECWLAQEELGVRREIVLLLKHALDSIGACKEVTAKELLPSKPPIPPGARRFRNRNWELDLIIDKGTISAKSTIRNVTPTRRPQALVNEGQGTVFRLRQGTATADLEPIRGYLLQYGDYVDGTVVGPSAEIGFVSKFDTIDLTQPFTVEQVFDKATSPLKRIEALEIGTLAMSHRIATVPLVLGPASPPATAQEGAASPDPSTMGPMSAGMGMGTMATIDPDQMTAQNFLLKKRYVQVNEQVRRMPVAFSVYVEQAYIQDVLAAVANSRLRIQTTQYHWQHLPAYSSLDSNMYPGPGGMPPMSGGPGPGPGKGGWDDGGGSSLGPKPMGGGNSGPSQPYPPMGGMPMGGLPFGGTPFGGTPFGGMPMSGGPGSEQNAQDTESVPRNLVELSVYGLASLYNRYPPKPPKPETTTTP